MLPQLPQLSGLELSVPLVTHAPLQNSLPMSPHCTFMQLPSTQRGFTNPRVPQSFLQAPQLEKSLKGSMHEPPQIMRPGRQAHLPPVQNCAEEQVVPQLAQLFGSFERVEQV